MRNFEEDFEFEFADTNRAAGTKACRVDSHRSVKHDPNRDNDAERQTRIAAHAERIQKELSNARVWDNKEKRHKLRLGFD